MQARQTNQATEVAQTAVERPVLREAPIEKEPKTAREAAISRVHAGRPDPLGRVVGLLITLVGVGIILFVVWHAFALYQDPRIVQIQTLNKNGPTATEIGSAFMRLILRIGLLLLMSIGGSMIANRGIHMFLASFPPTSRD